ncbi:MAG: hypothetical protein QW734_07625 [Candidatus Bathyarchaeia archaeon]
MSLRRLARKFGISHEWVRVLLSARGIRLRGGGGSRKGMKNPLWRMGYHSARQGRLSSSAPLSPKERAAMERILQELQQDPLQKLIPLVLRFGEGLSTGRLLWFARGAAFYHRRRRYHEAEKLLESLLKKARRERQGEHLPRGGRSSPTSAREAAGLDGDPR